MAMDVMRVYVVVCDDCGMCGEDVLPAKDAPRKADIARRVAADSGWVRRDGRDVCPVCVGTHVLHGGMWLPKTA